jgi:hypothetical protein
MYAMSSRNGQLGGPVMELSPPGFLINFAPCMQRRVSHNFKAQLNRASVNSKTLIIIVKFFKGFAHLRIA